MALEIVWVDEANEDLDDIIENLETTRRMPGENQRSTPTTESPLENKGLKNTSTRFKRLFFYSFDDKKVNILKL
ncbi:MAG: hypothetical protein AAGG59_01915 [Bacteroidota bacterium]